MTEKDWTAAVGPGGPSEARDAPPVGLDAGRRRAAPGRLRGRRGRRLACLLTALLLVLLVTGAGLLVRGWWIERFGDPADYAGDGSGSVQVDIPPGASLTEIGRLLRDGGVVASVEAFTRAASLDPKAVSVQPGDYLMHHRMSALSALGILTDPANAHGLTVTEGMRASQVYAAIDSRLGLERGTAAAEASRHTGGLGLPGYAADRLEGFLYPAKYSVTGDAAEDIDVAALLRRMVAQAKAEYARDGIGSGGAAYQIVVIASLVQAEAQEAADFGKVARVIRNRLDRAMPLQLDSALNYALGRSTLDTSHADTRLDSPYNTYLRAGLPPTPIGNPGHAAVEAALHPAPGDWLYFVTVRPGDTRFTASYEEHQRNVAEFNQYQRQQDGSATGGR